MSDRLSFARHLEILHTVAGTVSRSLDVDEVEEDAEGCVVPDTTCWTAEPTEVVMSVSLNPDVEAAARSEHAAIASTGGRRGSNVVFCHDQALRMAAIVVASVLAR